MEDIKILKAKLKLSQDINQLNKSLIWNIQEIAKEVLNILVFAPQKKLSDNKYSYEFTEEQIKIIDDLVYTVKSDNLISERTSKHLIDYAKEKEIKQEILNNL